MFFGDFIVIFMIFFFFRMVVKMYFFIVREKRIFKRLGGNLNVVGDVEGLELSKLF